MKENKLKEYREKIDKLDKKIVELLSKRFFFVKKIGKFKKDNNMQIMDSNRFKKILKKVENIASKEGISKNFIDDIYNIIHKYACELEKEFL